MQNKAKTKTERAFCVSNLEPVHDFLLVINSNEALSLLRYGDLLAQNRKFCLLPLI